MRSHFAPGDPRNSWVLPSPYLPASASGECARGREQFDAGDPIRADGMGGWECRSCVEKEIANAGCWTDTEESTAASQEIT